MYICDFHREQAWLRWIQAAKHGCKGIKDDLLYLLRSVACASTDDEYKIAAHTLQTSDLWQKESSSLLRKWFKLTWLTEFKVITLHV